MPVDREQDARPEQLPASSARSGAARFPRRRCAGARRDDLRRQRHDETIDHADADQRFDQHDHGDRRRQADGPRAEARRSSAGAARLPHLPFPPWSTRDSSSRMPRLASSRRSLPDLGDVAAERVAADDLGVARTRQVDVDDALQAPGRYVITSTRSDSCTASVRLCVMSSVVCAQLPAGSAAPCRRAAAASARRAPRTARPSAGCAARTRACARWRRAAACRRTARPDSDARSRQADQRDEVPRALEPLAPWRRPRARAETRRCRARCARETSTLPGTPCRSPDACRDIVAPATATRPS